MLLKHLLLNVLRSRYGYYNFEKTQNLDEPIFGIHDMYGYEESGIRSTDDLSIVGASIDWFVC